MTLVLLWGLAAVAWGEPARFHRLDGEAVNLTQLSKGSPTGLVLCVTWCAECPSCRRVEGQVEQLARDYDSQVRVVVVDVHAPDNPARIKKYLSAAKLGLDVVIDETLVDAYEVEKTATALLFDRQGRLRYFGAFSTKTEESARKAVAQLLRGQPVQPEKTGQNGCTFIPRGKRKAPPPKCDVP